MAFEYNEPASPEVLHNLLLRYSMMPKDYVSWLGDSDGGEGFLDDDRYLILWRAEEIEQFNREYEVDQYAPGLILIGSDGGGEGYAFDVRNMPWKIVRVPFIGMDLKHAIVVAESFTDFMATLSNR